MAYQVEVVPTAIKELEKLDKGVRLRIRPAIERLAQDPRPPGALKLMGSSDSWRIRVGDYRVLYRIFDASQTITIWRIAHRRQVYR